MSLNDRCSVSCTNLTRNDTKNLLEEQVSHDSTVSYMREERLNSKSQNIHFQSVGDSTTKHLNDFQDVSEKLNKDQPKGSIPNTCDCFKEITKQDEENTCDCFKEIPKQDEENIHDELFPLAFVAVSPVSEINEPIDGYHDNMRCSDSVLKDPLGEYSGNLNVAKERNIEEECTFQSEPQVKNEPKEENDVPESMAEVFLISDKLPHSCHELKSTESNPFVSCDEESAMESNPDVIISDTLCSEGCAAEETHKMEIKFESICEISGADVKEEKLFETGQCLNHCVDDGTGTPPLESESELLESGAQHFLTLVYQQDVNEEECDASTSKIGSPFQMEIGNKTAAKHRSAFTQSQLCEERRELMERTGSNSSHIASLNTKECNNQHLAPRDSFHLDPSELRDGLTGKVQTYSTKRKNYSCIRCKKSFIRRDHLKGHMRTHTGEKPFQCEICEKSFSLKCTLTKHMRTHTGYKPFKCEICGKSISQKGHLKKHMRTHTAEKPEKPHQCEICKKSFNEKGNLTRHMRTHSGEKPLKCEICEKSFIYKGQLTTHMRTHTREKPFQCEICKKSFNQKSHLSKHSKTHVGQNVPMLNMLKVD